MHPMSITCFASKASAYHVDCMMKTMGLQVMPNSYDVHVESDVEAGLGVARKATCKTTRTNLLRRLSSYATSSLEKLRARLYSFPISSYYSWYKAYVPDQDRLLRFIQYTLYFAIVMLPSSQGVMGRLPSTTTSLKGPLQHIYDRISFGRYLFRFYYLLDALKATRSGSWGGSSGVKKALGHAMAFCMVLYYPFEHCAFLLWYQPQFFPSRLVAMADFLWSIGSMWWFVYLLVELWYNTLVLRGRFKERELLRKSRNHTEKHASLDYRVVDTTLQIIRSSFYLLPSLHWALPHWDTDPLLSDNWCYGLMWMESIFAVLQYELRRQVHLHKA